MKRYLPFAMLLAGLLPLASPAQAASDGFATWCQASYNIVTSAAPDGSEVYGTYNRSGDGSKSTWIFDTATQKFSQFTDYSESAIDDGGVIMASNASGVRVGWMLDDEWRVPTATDATSYEEISDCPLMTAIVWKDGERIKLDHNKWEDPATLVAQDGTLPQSNNGFVACSVSEDGKVICGYLKVFTYMLPVKWTMNSDGVYESTMLSRQTGEFFYKFVGAAPDGSMMMMNTKANGGQTYLWYGNNNPVVLDYSESGHTTEDPYFSCLSPSGRYALLGCTRDGSKAYASFDLNTYEVRWIPIPDGVTSTSFYGLNTITDEGDGFLCDNRYNLYYFNLDLNLCIPFDSFVAAYGMTEGSGYSSVSQVKSYVGGKLIAGNYMKNNLEEKGWILQLPDKDPMLFAVTGAEALFSGVAKLLVKWEAPVIPSDATLKGYVVIIDNEEFEVADPEVGDDGKCRYEVASTLGDHEIVVYALAYDANGTLWESGKQTLSVSCIDKTDLFFFEDLTDAYYNEEGLLYQYEGDTFTPVSVTDSYTLSFRLDPYDLWNPTPFWYTCGFSTKPWDTYLLSRWFDASEASNFYLTWHEKAMTVNNAGALSDENRFSLEVTTDGENWTALSDHGAIECSKNWKAYMVDLDEAGLAGKNFRIRFHAHGEGKLAAEFRVDKIGIMSKDMMFDAPAGLMTTANADYSVSLAWKNNRGEYEVSYNENHPTTYNTNVGNEGEPLWVACDYGPDKLAAFEGKYISAVATFLYEPTEYEQPYHTTVDGVVFDSKGNQLSTGRLSDDAPWYMDEGPTLMPVHHIVLDTPVKIEAGETYRVAIKISDYQEDVCPIWYRVSPDYCIPGVTDLYSDDNLASWSTITDLYEYATSDERDAEGYAIFNIRPCITDSTELSDEEYCQSQWYYQVYRDGELAPTGISFFTQQSYTEDAEGTVEYTVRAFRYDGAVSYMSEPLSVEVASVFNVMRDQEQDLSVEKSDKGFIFGGDYDSVAVYSLDGKLLSTSAALGLEYAGKPCVVVVEKNGKRLAYRMIF